MNRFHIHLTVSDLDAGVRFYSGLFAHDPSVLKSDYAQWVLDDPRVNFAISTRSDVVGLNHLGIQAETEDELAVLTARLENCAGPVIKEGLTTCCYAESDKAWIVDPDGLPWEAYRTMGKAAVFSRGGGAGKSECCVPTAAVPVSMPKNGTPR